MQVQQVGQVAVGVLLHEEGEELEHDGVRGPNLATVYSDRGQGVRAPVVFYNRSNEAAGQLKPGDFNWNEIFGAGVRWFHSGGIFAALSETTGEVIIEAMKAAKASGAITSFDLNYRQKLWDIWGGQNKAVNVLARIVEHVDVLVGNEEDFQLCLGIEGPEAGGKGLKSKIDGFKGMIERVKKASAITTASPTNCPASSIITTRRRSRCRLAVISFVD